MKAEIGSRKLALAYSRRPRQGSAFTLLGISALLIACTCFAQEQLKHTISITFDYDFARMHACSKTVTKKCVVQFNVYDISGPKRYKLFSIPAPAGASGAVKGISGTSDPLLFEPGKHLVGVTAQADDGDESSPYACAVWTRIPPSVTESPPAVNNKSPS
jgi:hypothetical protein